MSAAAGPATGVLVLQRDGLGVPTRSPLDPFGTWHRSLKKYKEGGRQWFSPIAYYLGPFNEATGLEGSELFFRQANPYGKPPQVYVTATESRIGIIPITNWVMRKGRGAAKTIWLPYSQVQSVELRPATKARMPTMLPSTAWQLGQIILTCKSLRTATLSGTTVSDLSAFLASLGAAIES